MRMAARVLLCVLVASWCAPAALAGYASPQHACCRRGAHHCGQSTSHAFRDARMHCQSCQPLVTGHQSPRPAVADLGIAPRDEHPYSQEFASALPSREAERSPAQRAPPTKH